MTEVEFPPCPNCHRQPWNKLQKIEVPDQEVGGHCCVCMHCSSMWMLEDGAWRPLTAEEFESAGPLLTPIAMHYAKIRDPGDLREHALAVMKTLEGRHLTISQVCAVLAHLLTSTVGIGMNAEDWEGLKEIMDKAVAQIWEDR